MEAIWSHSRGRLLAAVGATVVVAALTAGLIASSGAPASTAQGSRAAGVNINHFKFHPGTLNVKKGTKVAFTNSAGVAHTATHKGVFDTGHIKPGHSAAAVFTQKGSFPYHCKIHPFMHGKIVVG